MERTAMMPQISVVIPTHDRCASLRRALDSLAAQTCPPSVFEVVVAADGCRDGTADMVRAYRAPFSLRLVEQPGLGAAAARNNGAAHATGAILLFLDDDLECGPGLVEAHRRAHAERAGTVVIGPYFPALRAPADLHRQMVRSWWEDHFHEMSRPSHRFTYRDLLGGNLSLERRLFLGCDGFDVEFRFAGRRACSEEDWELGVRLLQRGVEFRYVAAAVAQHHDHEATDLDRSLQRAGQEGRGDVLMGRRHAELRWWLPLARAVAPGRQTVAVAFRWPFFGDRLATLLRLLLPVLEWGGLRRHWRALFGRLRWYWYLRGAAEKLGTVAELRRFFDAAPKSHELPGSWAEIDLLDGIEAVERQADRARPTGLTVRYGRLEIGRIWPQPGVEPLCGRHLRSLLGPLLNRSNFTWLLAPPAQRADPPGAAGEGAVQVARSARPQT